MAETVSWDGLRELAEFRAEKGCAISFYLDLDPKTAPTAGDAATQVSALLADGERHAEANNRGLTHDQRVALKHDFTRIRDYFANEFTPGRCARRRGLLGRNGQRLAAARADRVGARPRPGRQGVPPRAARSARRPRRGGDRRRRRPRARRAVPAPRGATGRDRRPDGRRSRPSRPGRLVAVPLPAAHREARRGAPERGGRGARPAGAQDARAEGDRRLVGGDARRVRGAPLEQTKSAVVGWTSADAHASPQELLELTAPILDAARARHEASLLERWREGAGRGGRAASGWAETLEAASDARVEVLLYEEGADHEAWQCAACGRLSATGGQCPLDGTETDRRDDGLDLTVHQTVAHGGTVWAVTAHEDLGPAEGVAALLRY